LALFQSILNGRWKVIVLVCKIEFLVIPATMKRRIDSPAEQRIQPL